MLLTISYIRSLILNEHLWSGRQLLELIIPAIYLSKKNSQFNNTKDNLKHRCKINIENGKYNGGVMDKSILGNKSQGIIHIIYNDLGYKKAQEFLDDMQNIITNFLELLVGWVPSVLIMQNL